MRPVKVISYREMNNYPNHTIINTTSRSKDFGKGFSPFILGPVNTYDGLHAKNVENAWQFSKVYPQYIGTNGVPNALYYIWRDRGWEDTYAHRYPMGKGAKPLFSWWDGKPLDYIEARKIIYAPLYAQAVVHTKEFATLKELYYANDQFVLLDFDGYDYLRLGMTLNDVINDPERKMGHAFVLAMLLEYPELEERYK